MKVITQLVISTIGAGYYLIQGTRPQPRLRFDIPWILGVVLSGFGVVRESRFVVGWLASVVLLVGGFLMHFPSVVLGEYELPAGKAPQETIDAARKLQWKAKIITALGFLGILVTEFAAIRRK